MHSRIVVGVSTDSTIEIFRSFGLTRRYLEVAQILVYFPKQGQDPDDSLEEYFREKRSCLVVEARVAFLENVLDGFYLGWEDEPRMCFTAETDSGNQIIFNDFSVKTPP